MLKVGFWYDRPKEYTGGLNYFHNLLFALSKLNDNKLQPYIFFGYSVDEAIVDRFTDFATVVRTSILDRWSFLWFLNKFFFRFFGSLFIIQLLLSKHEIRILSHPQSLYSKRRSFRIINWIPDFQYLHLPELFPFKTEKETKRILNISSGSDALIFSSNDALKDYLNITKGSIKLAKELRVLQFVSQPTIKSNQTESIPSIQSIEHKYNFKGRYFFLPNQFWKHKNHSLVFSAVNKLKQSGVEVLLICTGNLKDYRLNNSFYFQELEQFIKVNELENNIKVLGLVDYSDVLTLLKNCIAVINPSKFEGWSSTVEEARSMGQRILLSDIPVHREQNPPKCSYFDLNDDSKLAVLIKEYWINSSYVHTKQDELNALNELEIRTKKYAEDYVKLVDDISVQDKLC
jgi:glycosyltransferase involved in cell wall biosynthesis